MAIGAVLASAALALGPSASPAVAGCGGPWKARTPHRGASGHPPWAIGDSVMLLAVRHLARLGFDADARGCRQISEALRMLRHRRRHHTRPQLTVIALGADWIIRPRDIWAALRILGPEHLLVLVTPRESGGGSGSDAAVIRAAGRRLPERVKVLDWVRFARPHPGWFQPDGLHLTWHGARVYARFIARALRFRSPTARRRPASPARRRPPRSPLRRPTGGRRRPAAR
jgi:hypothetical protein